MSSTRHLASLLLGLVLLSGCGSLDLDDSSMERMPDAGTTSANPSQDNGSRDAEPDDEPATSGPSMTVGRLRTVTSEKSGLIFGAPASWMIIDPERFDELPDEALEEMADAMNMSVEDVPLMMSQIDVMVMGADGSNINVTSVPLAGELPTAQSLREQFRLFNASVTDVEDVDTPVGPGRIARYDLDMPGPMQHGAGIFVRLSTGVTNLTITSSDTDLVESLIDKIVPTLDEGGAPGEA